MRSAKQSHFRLPVNLNLNPAIVALTLCQYNHSAEFGLGEPLLLFCTTDQTGRPLIPIGRHGCELRRLPLKAARTSRPARRNGGCESFQPGLARRQQPGAGFTAKSFYRDTKTPVLPLKLPLNMKIISQSLSLYGHQS